MPCILDFPLQRRSKIIVEGLLVNHDDEEYGQVEINTQTGVIEAIGKRLGKPDIRASRNQIIFPGFIDNHVHAREDVSGQHVYKEDYLSASNAAIAGGVVCFSDMPNNPKPPVDKLSYQQKRSLSEKSLVPVCLYAAIGPNTRPLGLEVPYKLFMASSFSELAFSSNEEIDSTLRYYSSKIVSFHCEDMDILEHCKMEKTHEQRRPPEAELKATMAAINMVKKHSLSGRIIHCSTVDAVRAVNEASKQGLDIISEVTPHHLYFDDSMITCYNRDFLRINCPIRSREDRMGLLDDLREGVIDSIGTDHSPHTVAEKRSGKPGMPHLDTYGAFVTWLIKEHHFSRQDIARISSYNPSQLINQFAVLKHGRIQEGYAGSLTILDPEFPTRVKASKLYTKCRWSPFAGVVFPGSVAYTIVQGAVYPRSSHTFRKKTRVFREKHASEQSISTFL